MSTTMIRQYKTIAKHPAFAWAYNKTDNQWYLYLAGHRVATVKAAFAGYGAWCPGGLVAYRKSLKAAKTSAIDAVRTWIHFARMHAISEPQEDMTEAIKAEAS